MNAPSPDRLADAIRITGALDETPTPTPAPTQLSTTQVISALCSLGRQLKTAQEHFDRIPEASRPDDCLTEIVRNCDSAIACAKRLLANNRKVVNNA